LKYKSLHQTAKEIDRLIDATLPSKTAPFPPQEEVKNLVSRAFPDLYLKSSGWHKLVFGFRSQNHEIVLKVGSKKTIENDHRAYKRVPEIIRHQLFARIFWHTKYCLLQQYGYPAHVSQAQLTRIRLIVYRYGLSDVKAENLKNVEGSLKIIDANVNRIPLPTVARRIDEVKPKLPKQLVNVIKKVTRMSSDR
jgi:hypothetical protein